jgi:hypothetical protein
LDIREVLNRRGDLSTFVVHLTKDGEDQSARQRLESILTGRPPTLEARTAMGFAASQDDPNDVQKQSQRVVCFTETPLEHIYSHVADIDGRRERFQPYGVALTKMTARRLGINPVFYVDRTPGQYQQWRLANAFEALMNAAIQTGDFHNQPIARVLPFVEIMGTWPTTGRKKEFWWEREWRHVSGLTLQPQLIDGLVLCPENEIDHFEAILRPGDRRGLLRQCIDPRWSVEQIVAHLGGISAQNVSPFMA